MFVCPIAAKAPSAMDAIDEEDNDLLPLRGAPGRADCVKRSSIAIAATFAALEKNAVTGVGAP